MSDVGDIMLLLLAHLTAAVVATTGPATIVTIVIDDLGHYDTAVYNPNSPTPALKALADGGVRLGRHYTYKFCSPTRRSFLSGRLPVHMTSAQAQPCTNWLPLEMEILPQKLKKAGFHSHIIGKGHWGYQTTDHLPINRGFDSHIGYLCGAENYDHGYNENMDEAHDCSSVPAQCVHDMWNGNRPGYDVIANITYSTNFYARRATALIEAANPGDRLGLFLLYQGVHVPYQAVPAWESKPTPSGMWDQTYSDMLRVVDSGVANITAALRATKRWENTLLLVTSDNGGILKGNNYPLRGLKATVWEGGSRVMAFIAGGFLERVPNFEISLKGTTNDRLIHVSDWYTTFATLVGVDPTDDIVYDGVVRPIDGIDVWPLVVAPAEAARAVALGNHAWAPPTGHNGSFIAITETSGILYERYKLITSGESTYWYNQDSSHILENRSAWPCRNKLPSPVPSLSVCPASAQVPGFACTTPAFCGPTKSSFYQGNLSRAECASACALGTEGNCECFNWMAEGARTCRLHHSATSIERSGEGWYAYASTGSDAREWMQTMAALAVKTTALDGATRDSAAPGRPASMELGASRACYVCTMDAPCLFDLYSDPTERVDIAREQPGLVATMQTALAAAQNWKINGTMNAQVLAAKYDCVTDTIPWWGNFSGPCCKRKS